MTTDVHRSMSLPDALPTVKGPDNSSDTLTIEATASGTPGSRSKTDGGHLERMQLGPGEVHPAHKPALPSHDAIKASPHYPVVVTPNPMVAFQTFHNSADPGMHLNINGGEMPLESDLFKGKIAVHLRGLPTTKKHVFAGKKRYFQIVVQGRFKRSVDADALCMGQEFVKPSNMPPWVGEMVLTAAAKVFSSSTQVDVYAPQPFFMNPILAACQVVNVSRPGQEPDMWDAQEDVRLLSPELAAKSGEPVTADKRRRWCDVPKNLEGLSFDTENTWTFHIWQHLIDFSTYKLNVGGFVNLDLTHVLNGQPLQLTCKDVKANEYSFSMLVWHERLLYAEDLESGGKALAERLGKMKIWPMWRSKSS